MVSVFLEGIIFLFILGSTFQKFHYLHFELSERVEKGHFFLLYLKPTFSFRCETRGIPHLF